MVVSQCNPPQEILDKYPRRFIFKDTDRKTILAEGVVEEVILVYHDDDPREYWKGVEKLRFNDGRIEFRFMYWARKKGQTNANWTWGQFNVCLPSDHLNKLIECMQEKGWIRLDNRII